MIDQKSIAVLPFENLSANPENEYFSDGMTEEIINALSKIEGLKVTARTSSFAFKNQKTDVRHIGNQLGVSTVMEGSIRKAGDRVRISAQLIRTDNGFHIWSENFDRKLTDIFDLQDEISLLIADKIRETFGHLEINEHLVLASTQNIEAYELFLKGQFHFKRKDFDDIQLAVKYLEEAIAVDSNYAEAYASLGEAYIHSAAFNIISAREGNTKAKSMAQKALQINDQEPKAYKVLAIVALFYEWKWNEAISAYNKALKAGMEAENDFISYYYIFIQKDFDLAIQVAQEWVEKDPLHAITHWQLGICYFFAQKFEKGIEALNESIRLDNDFAESIRWKGLCYAFKGDLDQAFTYVDQALAITHGEGLAKIDRLMLRILNGETESVIGDIETLETPDPCDKAQLYCLLKMPDNALSFLEEGLKGRSTMMVTLQHYFIWDSLRQEPAFQKLLDNMNFGAQKAHRPHNKTNQLIPNNNYGLTEGDISQILNQLQQIMKDEEEVVNHQLTLRSLAETLALHPNKLSWILNEKLGRNFNEYLNEHRLQLFQSKAVDPSFRHLSILGIAYESGFSSKSVFNEFFKKKLGLTPKAWLKSVS